MGRARCPGTRERERIETHEVEPVNGTAAAHGLPGAVRPAQPGSLQHAYARWLNADLALDIMQEAFMRLWRQWQDGEAILNPRAWLLRVARNLAEDHAKSAVRRNGTHPPQTMNGVRGHDPLPLEHLEREETFTQLRGELQLLSTADREILTLRYAMDYNANDIADMLGINATAVTCV